MEIGESPIHHEFISRLTDHESRKTGIAVWMPIVCSSVSFIEQDMNYVPVPNLVVRYHHGANREVWMSLVPFWDACMLSFAKEKSTTCLDISVIIFLLFISLLDANQNAGHHSLLMISQWTL